MEIIRDAKVISGFRYEGPFSRLPFLTHIGEALCAPDHRVDAHSHAGFEFICVRNGHVSWRIGQEEVKQKEAELVFTVPGQPHLSAPGPHSEHDTLWIGLRLDVLGNASRKLAAQLSQRDTPLIPHCGDVEYLVRGIIRQVLDQRSGWHTVVRCQVDLFVAELLQRLAPAAGRTRNSEVQAWQSWPVTKAMRLMHDNLHRRVALAEMVEAAACSQSLFCRLFEAEVGLPPAAYHRKLRLEAARAALRLTGRGTTGVAAGYGFSSSQHFSTCFRKAFGVSPRRWRGTAGTLGSPR